MHELPVTESVLEIALRHAEKANAARVTAVNLTIGELSSIVDDSVKFYWDIITENTICAGSNLVFKRLPAVLKCLNCGFEYKFDGETNACPSCGSPLYTVISGEEFFVDSIEIEKGKI